MPMFRSHQVNRFSRAMLGLFGASEERWKINALSFDTMNGFRRKVVEW